MVDYQNFDGYGESVRRSHQLKDQDRKFLEVINALLDFCSFQDIELNNRPQPFDDPFVGAFLTTGSGQIIGAHRKVRCQERHAEPNSIIAALQKVKSTKSAELLHKIDQFYQNKLWLESSKRQIEFEALFAAAGKEICEAFSTNELVLYSSLEPCRDYESQPSCADLVASTGVKRVVYGSDDLNEKGLGREKLLQRGVIVHPNINIEESTRINGLFFGALFVSKAFFDIASAERLFIPPKLYSLYEIDEERSPIVAGMGKNGRMTHFQNPSAPPRIYSTGPLFSDEFEASDFNILDELRNAKVDRRLVLQCGDIPVVQIARILADIGRTPYSQLPGMLIHSRDEVSASKNNSELESFRTRLNNSLESLGIQIFENAFRKHSEQSQARRRVFQKSLRVGDSNAVFVLVKISEPKTQSSEYVSQSGSPVDLISWLRQLVGTLEVNQRRLSKIGLYSDLANAESVVALLSSIFGNGRDNLKSGLRFTGIEIEFQKDPYDQTSEVGVIQRLNDILNRLFIANRTAPLKLAWKRPTDLPAWLLRRFRDDSTLDPSRLDPFTLASMASPESWEDRREVGELLGMQVCINIRTITMIIIEPLEAIVGDGLSEGNWAKVCVLFNALKHVWGNAGDFPEDLREQSKNALFSISRAIGEFIDQNLTPPAWVDDVTWRLVANIYYFVPIDEFSNIHPSISARIVSDPFLAMESFYYWYSTNEFHRGRAPWQDFCKFIGSLPEEAWTEGSAKAFATRVVRLFALDLSSGMLSRIKLLAGGISAFRKFVRARGIAIHVLEEFRQLRVVLGSRSNSNTDRTSEGLLEISGRQFSTYCGLHTLSITTKRTLFTPLPRSDTSIRREQGWRTDYFGVVSGLISDRPTSARRNELLSLCKDEDVTLRLAAVRAVLDGRISPKDLGFINGKKGQHQLLAFRHRCLELVRSSHNIYWIDRAIALGIRDIKAKRALLDGQSDAYPPLVPNAFATGIDNLLSKDNSIVHPEVLSVVQEVSKKCCRVLLLLPPITWPTDLSARATREGTPPLGLGMLASSLASEGHIVNIVDAHREGYSLEEVAKLSERYDILGISCVFSTLDSTKKLSFEILKRATRPKIVIGGQGASLGSHLIAADEHFYFDGVFLGNAMLTFPRYVALFAEIGHDLAIQKIADGNVVGDRAGLLGGDGKKRREGLRVAANNLSVHFDQVPWISRELFRTKDGTQFEPSRTRNGAAREAHIVTSSGCNWACTFCTEAIVNGGPMEVRRSATDVVEEIEYLVEEYGATRIQFVDDNTFPSAPMKTGGPSGSDWTSSLLSGMTAIRKANPAFTWRGLMRAEDLVFYQSKIDNFYPRLSDSGCNLIALGIEFGEEKRRTKSKGPIAGYESISNSLLISAIDQLKRHQIFSKGYFIIGGPEETETTLAETINFAVSSGLSLAYFALYKEFRSLAKAGQSLQLPKFGELVVGQLDKIMREGDEDMLFQLLEQRKERSSLGGLFSAYSGLSRMGFSFQNIFKYNDYHSDERAAFHSGFGSKESYFAAVLQAYLEFYARPEWEGIYSDLVASGY